MVECQSVEADFYLASSVRSRLTETENAPSHCAATEKWAVLCFVAFFKLVELSQDFQRNMGGP